MKHEFNPWRKYPFNILYIRFSNNYEMFRLFILFSPLTLIFSCSMSTMVQPDLELKNVVIHGSVHKPYCGGAKPSPDVAFGYYEVMSGQKFNVFKGTVYKPELPVIEEFTFDGEGNYTLLLQPGEYMLMHAEKALSLDEFINFQIRTDSIRFKTKGRDCFESWKNTVDLYLTVKSDTVLELREKAKCWIGTNQCLEYIGPPAP